MKLLLVFAGVLLLHRSAGAQDTNWVKKNTWYFDNFVKDILPWSLFKETFIGVGPTPSGDFDILFYESIYKKQSFTQSTLLITSKVLRLAVVV